MPEPPVFFDCNRGGRSPWRVDHFADRAARKRLILRQPVNPPRFDPVMVKDLPEPALRYFQFTLQPGTPLYTVAEDGSPLKVSFQCWSNANSDREFRLQPFGGYLSHYREFEGFRLPTRIEAGNCFEAEDYFPFFVVNVLSISYPQSDH